MQYEKYCALVNQSECRYFYMLAIMVFKPFNDNSFSLNSMNGVHIPTLRKFRRDLSKIYNPVTDV